MHRLLTRRAPSAVAALFFVAGPALAAGSTCGRESGPTLTPVFELYTSEGCSSCPPADRWLSTLKPAAARGELVAQAFHVGYWDYMGWVDRFAVPAHTTRQRQVASQNRLPHIYTPQRVRDGRDWRGGDGAAAPAPARARIGLRRTADDAYEAVVVPEAGTASWSAYWTVTEHGHSSKVKAGENAGESLQHDFVVRQYVPVGDYRGTATLTLRTVPRLAGHPRQVNLVVVEPASGQPLQALSLGC